MHFLLIKKQYLKSFFFSGAVSHYRAQFSKTQYLEYLRPQIRIEFTWFCLKIHFNYAKLDVVAKLRQTFLFIF